MRKRRERRWRRRRRAGGRRRRKQEGLVFWPGKRAEGPCCSLDIGGEREEGEERQRNIAMSEQLKGERRERRKEGVVIAKLLSTYVQGRAAELIKGSEPRGQRGKTKKEAVSQ